MLHIRLTIQSHTWTKESHGLFDYDLKDVLTATQSTYGDINILRKELKVQFSFDRTEDLIARIVNSSDKHWWIYHQFKYSGVDSQLKVKKDKRTQPASSDDEDIGKVDLIKDDDLFKNPERMLWKVVKFAYDAQE